MMPQCTAAKHLVALCYAKVTAGKVDTLKDKERGKPQTLILCTFPAEAGEQRLHVLYEMITGLRDLFLMFFFGGGSF